MSVRPIFSSKRFENVVGDSSQGFFLAKTAKSNSGYFFLNVCVRAQEILGTLASIFSNSRDSDIIYWGVRKPAPVSSEGCQWNPQELKKSSIVLYEHAMCAVALVSV